MIIIKLKLSLLDTSISALQLYTKLSFSINPPKKILYYNIFTKSRYYYSYSKDFIVAPEIIHSAYIFPKKSAVFVL